MIRHSVSTVKRSSPPLEILKMARVQGGDRFCLRCLLSDESWRIALTQKTMEMDFCVVFCDVTLEIIVKKSTWMTSPLLGRLIVWRHYKIGIGTEYYTEVRLHCFLRNAYRDGLLYSIMWYRVDCGMNNRYNFRLLHNRSITIIGTTYCTVAQTVVNMI